MNQEESGRKINRGNVVGPDVIPVEVWRCLGEGAVDILSLFVIVIHQCIALSFSEIVTLVTPITSKTSLTSPTSFRNQPHVPSEIIML